MIKKKIGCLLAAIMLFGCFAPAVGLADETEYGIALFQYSGGTAGAELSDGSAQEGYPATGGTQKDSSRLFASVDGSHDHYTKMEWSSSKNIYTYNGSGVSAPIMAASDSILWGEKPYFLIKTSTKGYENIKFSARVSGTKKGPKDYTLWYSTDGNNYTSVTNASVATNKDLDANRIFANIPVSGADNKDTVYFKIEASSTAMINTTGSFVNATGGEAAINDIQITGTSATVTPTLTAPVASKASGEIFSSDYITLSSSEGADIYYSTDETNFVKYTEPIYPVKDTDTVTITAYATMDGYNNSENAVYTYTCSSEEIAGFCFGDAADVEYVNGTVTAVSGVYRDARMTASVDTKNKYVPLFDSEEAALAISPDDSIGWSEGTYWQFELSTVGFNKVYISADACSSNKGPASMTLQYSTDGVKFKNVTGFENKALSDTLGAYYQKLELPAEAAGCKKLYVKIASLEDKSLSAGTQIWGSPNGNTYINNVVFSGDKNNTVKQPVTTKKTNYFGLNGTVEYTSYDGLPMKYNIYDKNGVKIVSEADYPREGIALAKLAEFDRVSSNVFDVEIWSESNGEKSLASRRTYTYKGDDIAIFNIDKNTVFAGNGLNDCYASEGALKEVAKLYMKPNGSKKIALELEDDGNLRASASNDNQWSFDTKRANPTADGGWIINMSTKGYHSIVLTAKQSSTDKGPRDFCLAYSTDNVTFTNIPDSSVKLSLTMETTYANFKLPDEISDKEQVYIKIKIDGSKNTGGADLSLAPSNGHTQINAVEVCGLPITEPEVEYNMTQVEFGGTLEGAEISEDSKVLRDIVGAGVITAWRGTAGSGASSVTVSATICEEDVNRTAKKSFALPADIDAEAIFYVLADRDDIISMKYKVN